MATTAMARRKKNSNILSSVIFLSILLLIIAIVLIQTSEAKKKIANYSAQEQELDLQIQEEQARTEELEQYEKYVQTKAYVEEQAQEKFGLVKEGEIIFRRE